MIIKMFSNGLLDQISNYQSILEKVYIKHRALEDLDLKYHQNHQMASQFLDEIKQLCEAQHSYRLLFLNQHGRDSFNRFSTWLMAVINNLDNPASKICKGQDGLVIMLPELLPKIPFEIFRIFLRARVDLQEDQKDKLSQLYQGCLSQSTFKSELCKFIAKNFFNAKIANPDLKELMIIRLNMMLQHQDCINQLEKDPYSQQHLVPVMLSSLGDQRWDCHTLKNVLRLQKGKGFKEIVYRGVNDSTYSELFLNSFRKQILLFESETTKNFMHNVLSSLNDYTSEIFMIFKEVQSASVNQKTQLYRRIKFYLDITIDLCRVLELLSRVVPEIFLTRSQMHATRLFDYCLFVLRSIFTMKMDKLFVEFCDKIKTKSRTLP